ncbi:hypothetical protein [Stutzerimonas tarimensis]|uniref:Solute-binding protein family 3/N-terminal domain-containing protein n=1 Tax=Stutzerimonas tarimensis TaxID=1507735 RepID=A0ABV7TB80_9GAMM
MRIPSLSLALCALLAMPVWAQPLRVELAGDYRPLLAAEPRTGAGSFERELIDRWAESMGRTVQVAETGGQADLRMGLGEAGIAYYQSEPAALTLREGGLADLNGLEGKSFCVVAGSPHIEHFSERFAASAKRYSSAAQALAGLAAGNCAVLIEDRVLLEEIAAQPEWDGFARVLTSLPELAVTLRVSADDAELLSELQPVVERENLTRELTSAWAQKVRLAACALDARLDCH